PQQWPELNFPRSKRAAFRPTRWLAAAAAVAAVFLLVWRFAQPTPARAAELLRRAITAEQASPAPAHRIRIRSRSHQVDRTASIPENQAENSDTAALHALFDTAGYSWYDPLSVAAYSHWRDSQTGKHDQVTDNAGMYLVRTTPSAGVLSEAVLTLRTSDLHA